ncbi:MAG: pyridoxamine 5'-phosphate oxidase family protein [Pseudomonadales bacterium]
MTEFYSPEQRELQDAFDTKVLADALTKVIVTDEIPEDHAAFISSRDFFFLSSVNANGEPTVSYKGGAPGFVHIVDPKTFVFPHYDGNGMFLSMGNVTTTAKIGLLFIDFETPHRVRLQATATAFTDDPMMEQFPGANLVVRATVDSVFVNCGRYIHKHQRMATSKFVPDENGDQPFPAWKRIDLIQDALPQRDKGLAEANGGTMSAEEYAQRIPDGQP